MAKADLWQARLAVKTLRRVQREAIVHGVGGRHTVSLVVIQEAGEHDDLVIAVALVGRAHLDRRDTHRRAALGRGQGGEDWS